MKLPFPKFTSLSLLVSRVIVLGQSCLITCFVNFFFKFFHSLQFLTDSFHIAHVSSLGGSAFGLWSAWRYGDFWRFGDFKKKMVLHIRTL